MNRPRIVIVGASGHGRVALDAARCQALHEVVGWLDTNVQAGTEINGFKVLGPPADIARLAEEHRIDGFFLGVSDNTIRARLFETLRTACPRLDFVTIIHPAAIVASGVEIGAGSLILAGAIINTGSRIGLGCIVNTGASLDHDGEMHAWSSLLPGVVTGGNVVVGAFSCLCLGTRVAHKVRIAQHVVVGAGAVVLADLPPLSLAYGVPARVVRSRQPGERHY